MDRDRFVVRTDSHPTQTAAARAGLGIAVIQRPIGLADPNLSTVLPNLALPSLETWIVTHENLRQLPRVRAVFDHLATAFAGFARTAADPARPLDRTRLPAPLTPGRLPR